MLRELLETILPEKATFNNYEVQHDFATIGKRTMLLNARQIQRESGKQRIILLAIEDVTSRRQLEDLLAESEERYRRLFETASDGIVLLEKSEGRITHANPATEQMLGYNKKESIGNKLQDIGISLDMDDFQTTMRNLNKSGMINYRNVKVETKSGQNIDTEIYLVDRAKLVQCNIRDITERKQTAEQLSQSQLELQALMDVSPIGICWADMQGNILYNNQKFRDLFGYTVEDIPTVAAWRLLAYPDPVYREQIPSIVSLLAEVQKQGKEADPIEVTVTCEDGSIRHVLQAWAFTSNRILVTYADLTERKRAEEALRKTEEMYHLVVDNISEGITVLDLNLRFTYVSPSITHLRGYTVEEVMAQTIEQVMTPESLQIVAAVFEEEMKLEASGMADPDRIRTLELEEYRKDGSTVWLENHLSSFRDKENKLAGIIVLSHDITERKRADKQLKESESKYRLLADNIDDTLFVLDINLNYTYASPAVKTLMGYEPEELLNLRASETMTPSSWDMSVRTLSEFMEMEKSGQRENKNPQMFELEMKRKDGSTVWTEIKVSFIRDENQWPRGLIGVSRDITNRKRVEEALQDSEEQYRLVVENAKESIIITQDTKVVFVNCATIGMVGYSKEILTSKSFTDFIHPDDLNMVVDHHIRRIKGEEVPPVYSFRVIGQDGTVIWVEINATLIQWKEKPATLNFLNNITERKQAEDELQQTLESLKKAVDTTIHVMVSVIEARDPYTAGHQLRVADLARAIATEMGLDQEKIDGIQLAGSIHDIGKLSIPAEILSKPTKLTKIEFSMIKEHPGSGYEILKNVESPWPLAQVAYQHHERMDGSGYPKNLKGEEIIMEARIMAVADVVEAMASHRPYRAALGIEAALEEIEKNKGILYDATVADACLKLFREKNYKLIT
jgi:PAS domain S-box-containing protein